MLGSRTLPAEEVDSRWEPLAVEITETCYQMYRRTRTGLSPEFVDFDMNAMHGADIMVPRSAPHNLLRPEAAEAIYYMWYYTGDPKYRRMAHEMFTGFQKYCKAAAPPPELSESSADFASPNFLLAGCGPPGIVGALRRPGIDAAHSAARPECGGPPLEAA